MTINELKLDYRDFLIDDQIESLNLTLAQPNIFEILKISSAEIRHSNFLSWLLYPNGSHGLGTIILKRLLSDIFFDERANDIDEITAISNINYSNIKIHREWENIDILIESDKYVICIENKVRSRDSLNQLLRYEKLIKSRFQSKKKVIFVYLTIAGEEPVNYKENGFIIYSYKKLYEIIVNTKEILKDNIPIKTAIYIDDYLTILNRTFMIKPENEKAIEYAQRIYRNHKELIDFVIANGIIDRFSEGVDGFVEKFKDEFEEVKRSKSAFSFIPKKWSHNIDIEPLKDERRIQLGNSYGQAYPLYVFFEKRKKLNLVIELGPFAESHERSSFLSKLLEAGELTAFDKNLTSKLEKAKSSFTRILVKSKAVDDWENPIALLEAMEELYKNNEYRQYIDIISRIDFTDKIAGNLEKV